MDSIDLGLLHDLNNNCRITYQDLSRKYGISANAIRKRVLKLEETGVIASYHVRLSLEAIGSEMIFGLLSTDGSKDEEEFTSLIGQSPYIRAAASYTNGLYALLANYTNSTELLKAGSYLRGLDGVENAEIHPLLTSKGGNMDFSNLHIRVLDCLANDPRMPIVDIAQRTGLTARRVRKLIQEMIDSDAVRFTVLYKLGAIGSVGFLLRIAWQENETDHKSIIQQLKSNYPLALIEYYISAIEPTIFCLFTAEDLNEVDQISRATRRESYVNSVKVMISKHHKYFGGLFNRKFQELIGKVSQ